MMIAEREERGLMLGRSDWELQTSEEARNGMLIVVLLQEERKKGVAPMRETGLAVTESPRDNVQATGRCTLRAVLHLH